MKLILSVFVLLSTLSAHAASYQINADLGCGYDSDRARIEEVARNTQEKIFASMKAPLEAMGFSLDDLSTKIIVGNVVGNCYQYQLEISSKRLELAFESIRKKFKRTDCASTTVKEFIEGFPTRYDYGMAQGNACKVRVEYFVKL